MLDIKGLCAYYGDSIILKDIDMRIHKGQVVCLLGRNGVGKTTLLKSIMGLVKTPNGSIKLQDTELGKMPTY
ncbi:MAG TPA: ATP-binding cassette domain-containing protein, partial [Clostridia bacterium]